MLDRLISPTTRMNFLLSAVGIDKDGERALARFLKEAIAPFPPAVALFGDSPDIRKIISKVGTLRGDRALVGQTRSLMSNPAFLDSLTKRFEDMLAQHPDGEAAINVLSRISHLPIEGFGDVEHAGPVDFIRSGVIPYVLRLTEPEPETVQCHCGAQFPISDTEYDLGVTQCRVCSDFIQFKEES